MRREEYPRPQFVRNSWQNLNGEWDFAFDENDEGMAAGWFRGEFPETRKIQVPYVYQSVLSGIGEQRACDVVWYRRTFEVPADAAGKQLILHFGAVDYAAKVFLNGCQVIEHEGGHTPFSVNVTPFLLTDGDQPVQTITVRVYDPLRDEEIPRGKQYWKEKPESIWYTPSTGIWQTVWIEWVNRRHIDEVRFTSNLAAGTEKMEIFCDAEPGDRVAYDVRFREELIASGQTEILQGKAFSVIDIVQNHIFRSSFHGQGMTWSPEHPNLFDVTLRMTDSDGLELDRADTYFGFREIEAKDGMTYLNGRPYYQKLVLDQGYWRLGLLTAPTDEDFRTDICLSKEMGFNGCRKHQKMEDPRFLYWADRLGYLVWGECAAAPAWSEKAAARLMKEWAEVIRRDYNHPCIVAWTPINESWGVPEIRRDPRQQAFAQALYMQIHTLDGTRPVSSNDGWEQTVTDICALHNYSHGQKEEVQKYQAYRETLSDREHLLAGMPAGRPSYADGYTYRGEEPIILTEFGGIAYDVTHEHGWGYTTVHSPEEFLADYARMIDAIYASKALWGFCYTQITDVEQEINGLLTYDRAVKCPLDRIRAINDRFHRDCVEDCLRG